jgi:16S rRNA (guanine527-N7)-methyltransferase
MIDDSDFNNVSRETIEQLRLFEALAQKWTRKINLVSARDISQIWSRHIVDSMQVFACAPGTGDWLDLGSGGGFPGIVAAIMARESGPDRNFTLVDSDQRKCAFLRTVSRDLGLSITVHASRIDELDPIGADVLSARALSDLGSLLHHAEHHLAPNGIALFPKGATWEKEHREAQKHWSYELEVIKSETNPDATILKIKELTRV